MFKKKNSFIFKFTTALLAVCLAAAPINSQEIGGSLGSSKNVFRSKTSSRPKTAAKIKTAKPPRKSSQSTLRAAIKSKNVSPLSNATRSSGDGGSRLRPENSAVSAKTERRFRNAVEEGDLARRAGNYVQAEESYKTALTLKPCDARALQKLGNVYFEQQIWSEAERYYRQTVSLDAANFDANLALSQILSNQLNDNQSAARLIDAEAFARRAVELNSQSPAAVVALGAALEARGIVTDEVENLYRRAIKLDSKYALAYAHLARFLRKKGRIKEALEADQKAMQFADDVSSLILTAEVLQTERRFDESHPLLRSTLSLDNANFAAFYLLGRAHYEKQNYQEAERYLLRGVDLNPRSFDANFLLGSLYLRTSRFESAEKTLLNSLLFASETERKLVAALLSSIADGYLQKKMTQHALRVLRKARELDANNPKLDAKIAAARAIRS